MDKLKTAALLSKITGSGNIHMDEPMKNHTSFRLGGPAEILVTPESTAELVAVYQTCLKEEIPFFIMGNGTNLIIRDKGVKGVVIKTRENLSNFEINETEITAESGILLSRLSRLALENGLTGLEFAEGIPGTLGGAVAMNAGAYDGDMSGIVVSSEYLGQDGKVLTLNAAQHQFGKRSSFVQSDGGLVLKTCLGLQKGDREKIKAKMNEFSRQRHEKQPLELPSAGSVFKRPDGYFSGKLIQDCGLRGFRMGGAEVSGLHCGFIVNTGTATAADVEALIKHIQKTVFARFGVQLQTEVKIIGEES